MNIGFALPCQVEVTLSASVAAQFGQKEYIVIQLWNIFMMSWLAINSVEELARSRKTVRNIPSISRVSANKCLQIFPHFFQASVSSRWIDLS